MPDDVKRCTKQSPVLKKLLTVIVMMIAGLHADTTHFSMAGVPKVRQTLRSVWCTCVRRQSSSTTLDDDMWVEPYDITQSSGDCPYQAGVFPN